MESYRKISADSGEIRKKLPKPRHFPAVKVAFPAPINVKKIRYLPLLQTDERESPQPAFYKIRSVGGLYRGVIGSPMGALTSATKENSVEYQAKIISGITPQVVVAYPILPVKLPVKKL